MVTRIIAAVLAVVSLGQFPVVPPYPLTIGDPAPPLALKAFLKGEPIKELKKGTVYVIEFSGTQCAPLCRGHADFEQTATEISEGAVRQRLHGKVRCL